VLTAGGIRASRVRLAPVLRKAGTAALELGAADRKVRVVVAKPDDRLIVKADPRVVVPAVRGLLRAALQVARPGATIEVGADARSATARVDFAVSGCRKLPGNRLPDLLALSLARRAAKASGGSLTARLRRHDGCEFHLALPRAEQQ
jgi:signal transduction histidine kinase